MKTCLFILVLVCSHAGAWSQSVSFRYESVKLGSAIRDIETRYGLLFSYSPNHIPLQQRVTAEANNLPLHAGLDLLFAQTPVVYSVIGNQIALKTDPNKPIRKPEKKPAPKIIPVPKEEIREQPQPQEEAPEIDQYLLSYVEEPAWVEEDYFEDATLLDWARRQWLWLKSRSEGMDPDNRYLQVSVLPGASTNGPGADSLTNRYSFNLLGGTNGGVQGLETGLFYNELRGDLAGTQISGLVNVVHGNSEGNQIAGVYNRTDQMLTGKQISGGVNEAGSVRGTQISPLANVSDSVLVGSQIALVANKAGEVRGFQIGLINFADTVSGASIGLINVVRKGYNHLEVSHNDLLFANLAFRFGSEKFYNILHTGMRWYPGENGVYSWGLGYGIGASMPVANDWTVFLDYTLLHLNEKEVWTSELNLVQQLRPTIEWRPAKRFAIFAGVALNVQASRLYDAESAPRHPLTLFTKNNGTYWQSWLGWQAGLRF